MPNKYGIARGVVLSDDELMHWKYIKREKKPGGGYRYWYDTEATKLGRLRKNTASDLKNVYKYQSDARRFKNQVREYDEEYMKAYNKSLNTKRNNLSDLEIKSIESDKAYYDELGRRAAHNITIANRWADGHTIRTKKGIKDYESYKSSLGGKIDSFIEKASYKTVNTLNNLEIKKNKAKKWLSNLFDK